MTLPIPTSYPPTEALLVGEIPAGSQWQYEPKWDGFRCVAFRDGDSVALHSKSGQPLARYFPELVEALRSLPPARFVLDGARAGGAFPLVHRAGGEWEPLEPTLVAEVEYDHFTGGRFRRGTKLLRYRPERASEDVHDGPGREEQPREPAEAPGSLRNERESGSSRSTEFMAPSPAAFRPR